MLPIGVGLPTEFLPHFKKYFFNIPGKKDRWKMQKDFGA